MHDEQQQELDEINKQLDELHEKYKDVDVRHIPLKDMWKFTVLDGEKDWLTVNEPKLKPIGLIIDQF